MNLQIEEAFRWTLNNSAAAVGTAILAGLLLRLFGKWIPPRGHYWLWWIVLWRLCIPVAPGSAFSLENWLPALGILSRAERADARAPIRPGTVPGAISAAAGGEATATELLLAIAGAKGNTPPPRPADVPARGAAEETGTVAARRQPVWMPIACGVWLAGSGAYLLCMLAQHVLFARRMRAAVLAPAMDRMLAEVCAATGLRQKVPCFVLEDLESPLVFGWLCPRLVLPLHALRELPPAELRYICLHELTHVRRRDVLLNWVWVAFVAWHWFNPFVWLAVRRLRAEREVICDAAVCSTLGPAERIGYGATLLRFARAFASQSSIPGLTFILNQPHTLERRIRMISRYSSPSILGLFRTILLIAVVAGFTYTRAAEKEPARIPSTSPGQGTASRNSAETGDASLKAAREQKEKSIVKLERELAKMEDSVRQRKETVNVLKEKYQADEPSGGYPRWEILRRLETARIDAEAQYGHDDALLQSLTNLTRRELVRVLPTALGDTMLVKLLEEQSSAELKLVEASEHLGEESGEIKTRRRLLKVMGQQIDERVDGILHGLRIRLAAMQANLKQLRNAVDEEKRHEIEMAITRGPYDDARRELENLQFLLDRLRARVVQERLDASELEP